jgi:hypothetical protein
MPKWRREAEQFEIDDRMIALETEAQWLTPTSAAGCLVLTRLLERAIARASRRLPPPPAPNSNVIPLRTA